MLCIYTFKSIIHRMYCSETISACILTALSKHWVSTKCMNIWDMDVTNDILIFFLENHILSNLLNLISRLKNTTLPTSFNLLRLFRNRTTYVKSKIRPQLSCVTMCLSFCLFLIVMNWTFWINLHEEIKTVRKYKCNQIKNVFISICKQSWEMYLIYVFYCVMHF